MKNKKIIRIILCILIIMWMIIVFSFSNQTGTESSGISRNIAQIFSCLNGNIDVLEIIIRKIAHLTEYAIGGILFLSLMYTYDISENKQMIYSALLGLEYASIDEIHQLFIDGRSAQVIDVIIDWIGVGIGICLVGMIKKIFEKFCKN